MDNRYNWGIIIRDMQDKLFMSQQQLADTFHVSQQAIASWISGTREPSSIRRMLMLEFAAKHGIRTVERDHVTEMMAFIRSRKGKQFVKLIMLYDRLSESERRGLLKCAERLCSTD